MSIPFFKVSFGDRESRYIRQVLESGWLTTGKFAHQLESQFANLVGARHALAVNSCTAALHLALEALGVQYGHKVFVPTLTFTATAEVVRYVGADPILLDVDRQTRCISPDILKEAIKQYPGVSTLILVHFGGRPADLYGSDAAQGISNICRDNGIQIVHDAAHAFPTKLGSKFIGGIPDITCFSFYANKTITTGEGGMLTTESDDIYNRAKLMRLHGIDRDVWDRFTSKKPNWEYDVIAPGFKYNMPDLAAAIGLAQLDKAMEFREQRARLAEEYFVRLSSVEELELPPPEGLEGEHAWHLFPVCLTSRATLGRNELIELLAAEGVGTSVHYKPLHQMKYFRDRYNLDNSWFPNAEAIWRSTFTLPLYPSLTCNEIDHICGSLKKIFAKSYARRAAA